MKLDLDKIVEYILALPGIVAALGLIFKPIRNKFTAWLKELLGADEMKSDIKETKQAISQVTDRMAILLKGQQDTLRKMILDIYDQSMQTHTLTPAQRECLEEMFPVYEEEGGNGTIKKLYKRMMAYPVAPCAEYEENND